MKQRLLTLILLALVLTPALGIATAKHRLTCQERCKVHQFLCWTELLTYAFHAVFRE